ncbi:biopolymer transporter ExbD [Sphingomonas sp. LaA6.9]|uniref:ExbD/TolR family protein n=1 Tax=Sphingomonas sp. LaA6.9 TaxID=2919914 RepID=UPI001F4F2EFB|nr:biopolymer transporter ExbD [Sphingomonas sp. LaA6.9]MCJ8158980.1 biopolymer transporter ExbD [Sphingomonas sp. LaA6.9]
MRRRTVFAAPAQPTLMKDLNTTPLIDVMLVLLVMFIMVIPIQLHKVPVDLPGKGATDVPRPVHRLDITAANALLWDGQPVSEAALPARLAAMTRDPAGPVLHVAADGAARYEVFDRTLATVKQAGITRLGMVGNERYLKSLGTQ